MWVCTLIILSKELRKLLKKNHRITKELHGISEELDKTLEKSRAKFCTTPKELLDTNFTVDISYMIEEIQSRELENAMKQMKFYQKELCFITNKVKNHSRYDKITE